ncbi:hypothetical protein QTL95_03590 [Rhizobium sp. S152]|uniref:hypothetical protein n=1 Tax=Rhizobium sp. S152 TaxID=3055038 RepID=UPI0025A9BE6A|nr:hypothetical protein [Rhizobium sp. S152]MDM9624967.1 hypothetical protein [Rhizobium sp. S152]
MPEKTKRHYRRLLQDPMIRQMMAADGVCPLELETLLNEAADRLPHTGRHGSSTYIVLRAQVGRFVDERHSAQCSRLLRMGCSPTVH